MLTFKTLELCTTLKYTVELRVVFETWTLLLLFEVNNSFLVTDFFFRVLLPFHCVGRRSKSEYFYLPFLVGFAFWNFFMNDGSNQRGYEKISTNFFASLFSSAQFLTVINEIGAFFPYQDFLFHVKNIKAFQKN